LTCEILSGERFERVLAHRATAEDIELLRAHLETACEACLERLAEVEDERLLLALGGPALSAAEADEMFAAVAPRSRSWSRPLALAASLLLAATTGALFLVRDPELRDKGGPALELSAFAAVETDAGPRVERQLESGALLQSEERVLFRYRLGAPGYLYLVTRSVRGEELAYASPVRTEAGEHEVAENGRALALDPSGMGPKLEIIAIASATPLHSGAWLACEACGRDGLVLVTE
jgi:hypothetical protein